MLEDTGRIIIQTGQTKKVILYIPMNIVKDNAFPFKAGPVKVRIEGSRLVVEKL